MNHEDRVLTISNVSRSGLNKYECVADNGILPSVSKRFTLTVHCKWLVIFICVIVTLQLKAFKFLDPPIVKSAIYQETGQSIVVVCRIIANPECTINWYKLKSPESGNKSLEHKAHYELIEPLVHTRYEIRKSEQSNQTVSYITIKVY